MAPIYAIPVACEPPHGREVGELCLGNDDCASQICNHDISSQYGYCGGCGILGILDDRRDLLALLGVGPRDRDDALVVVEPHQAHAL